MVDVKYVIEKQHINGKIKIFARDIELIANGYNGSTGSITTATEEYNGTSWATSTAMATARSNLGGAGTQAAGLGFGGANATVELANTEEYTDPTFSTKTITTS